MKNTYLIVCVLFASCATSAPDLKNVSVNEVRHLTDAEVERMEGIDVGEWNAARSDILRTFAFRALESNLIEEAREYLSEACEINAEDTVCHAALARLFLAEGEVTKALAYAERAALFAPNDPEINMVYAAALAESGQTEKASATLKYAWEAIENDPSFARVMLTHYAATGQTEQAQNFVCTMLKEGPQHASSWTTSGDLLLSQGDLTAAAEAYRTAIEMDPNVDMPESIRIALNETVAGIDPMFSAAQRAEENGDLDSAINLLRFLIERDPQNGLFLMTTARVYWAQHNSNQAQNFLSRVAVIKRDWRGHILQAKLDITNKRFTQARTALKMAASDRDGIRSIELLMQYVDSKIATAPTDGTSL